ncbi:MAG: hypothetical protein LLG04_06195 [Parachlamydia sp.]|nr:hypothetical protein [Parachlamydia sp.]
MPCRLAPASSLQLTFQQQRFPVERLRTLLTNLFLEVSCDSLLDLAPCNEDRKVLQAICEQFRKAYPYSPLSSLLSFVKRNPADMRLELLDNAEKADEEEKLANTSRVLAMLYLNSTALWLQSNTEAVDSSPSNLPGMPMMRVLKDKPAMLAMPKGMMRNVQKLKLK